METSCVCLQSFPLYACQDVVLTHIVPTVFLTNVSVMRDMEETPMKDVLHLIKTLYWNVNVEQMLSVFLLTAFLMSASASQDSMGTLLSVVLTSMNVPMIYVAKSLFVSTLLEVMTVDANLNTREILLKNVSPLSLWRATFVQTRDAVQMLVVQQDNVSVNQDSRVMQKMSVRDVNLLHAPTTLIVVIMRSVSQSRDSTDVLMLVITFNVDPILDV